MASSGSSNLTPVEDRGNETDNSLEKIKKQLTSASGRTLLQGPLLKRSETLRKWNERWMTLDPTTGKMEYRARRNDLTPKGIIIFDMNSTVTVSPINFHGLQKYDGCCFYIGTPQKKEYFLCAETPGATKAWVSTLRASQLVLKAHRDAVNSLSGNGTSKLGTVAAVVAAANSTARESAKEISAAMQISMKAALGAVTNQSNNGYMDDMTVMKETLKVKDEELHQLARELRARDSTIKEIADKLSETAEAAESAASAAHTMDKERKAAIAEIQRLSREMDEKLQEASLKIKAYDEKLMALTKERDIMMKQRDSALQEAHLWRSELAKARERAVIMEAALVRAEERAKFCFSDAEARVKEAVEKQLAADHAKEEVLKEMSRLQAELRRQSNHMGSAEVTHPNSDTQNITAIAVESHVLADCNSPMEKSTNGPQDLINVSHPSETKVIPSASEGSYVLVNELKAQPADPSTQIFTPPECSANSALISNSGEASHMVMNEMKVQRFDPNTQIFTPQQCVANSSEILTMTTLEDDHHEATCTPSSIDSVETLGSPDELSGQLTSTDETSAEKMQNLILTNSSGASDDS